MLYLLVDIYKMESSKKEKLSFDGTGNVNEFIAKVELRSALKKYEGEQLAMALASHLQGNAFDVYLRMPDDEKTDALRIKAELRSEYELGKVDREQAVLEFSSRKRLSNEPAKTYAYKLEQLATLAYPEFTAGAKAVVVKDAYVRGLHTNLQLQLKSLEKFATADVKTLVAETTRLEVAGVKSAVHSRTLDCNAVELDVASQGATGGGKVDEDLIQRISDTVIEKLQQSNSVNFVGSHTNYERKRGRGNNNSSVQKTRYSESTRQRKCRNCGSISHLVRQCPTRFCAACGEKGHDSWDKQCSKYL